MNDVYAKLKELGLELPVVPPKGGVYSSAKRFGGNLIYISGCGPVIDAPVTGRVGQTCDGRKPVYVYRLYR